MNSLRNLRKDSLRNLSESVKKIENADNACLVFDLFPLAYRKLNKIIISNVFMSLFYLTATKITKENY